MSFEMINGKDKKDGPLTRSVKNKTRSTKFSRNISSDNIRK